MLSYFADTAWLFDVLVNTETRLRNASFLDPAAIRGSFFHMRVAGDISSPYMGDDHLLFLHSDHLSVMHLIHRGALSARVACHRHEYQTSSNMACPPFVIPFSRSPMLTWLF
jgi:hypothetical protein